MKFSWRIFFECVGQLLLGVLLFGAAACLIGFMLVLICGTLRNLLG